MSTGRHARTILVALTALAVATTAAWSQDNPEFRQMNRPVAPFRIFGQLYYVGASDIAVYAVATPDGLILLDGGFAGTAPQVLANLESLGFRIEDVKILLNSHAHLDHAGGLAELKAKSGAQLVASEADAPLLESGGRGDFAFDDRATYPPVKVDRRLRDGDTVSLGGVTLTAQMTGGHTKGCTTWTGVFEQSGVRRNAVFVCSTSVPSPELYRLADNPRYPEIATDYERTFERLRSLPCDLFLAAHGVFFDLETKRKKLEMGAGVTHPFVDPDGYRAYLDRSEASFRKLLAAARAAAPAP